MMPALSDLRRDLAVSKLQDSTSSVSSRTFMLSIRLEYSCAERERETERKEESGKGGRWEGEKA